MSGNPWKGYLLRRQLSHAEHDLRILAPFGPEGLEGERAREDVMAKEVIVYSQPG